VNLYADGVLAGAYRGRDISQRNLLSHAVSDTDFAIGRLRRRAGQALCVPTLDMSQQQLPLAQVDCPRCREIVMRAFPQACPRSS
jgi:hypothetical protein